MYKFYFDFKYGTYYYYYDHADPCLVCVCTLKSHLI
jgi:hypothetical protein